MTTPNAQSLEGLIERCIPEPMSGCWLWLGTAYEISGRWKPYYFMGGRQWLAHRASKWLHDGPFDLAAFICHRCDNPLCVNPGHLYVGDHASNMEDMARRKRAHFSKHPEIAKEAGRKLGSGNSWAVGARNPKAKLTPQEVDAIRADARGTKVLASIYSVDRTTIQRIRRGSLWNV